MTGLPILNYHALDDSGSVISTTPKWFAQTLTTLHSAGFRCIDLNEWIDSGRPEIERGFALTFDDALASIRLGLDTIVRLGFTATVFVVTNRIGQDNQWIGQPRGIPHAKLLDASELDELSAAGCRLGAHSLTHERWSRLTPAQIEREIVDSRVALEQLTGMPCRLFAYPYGDAPRPARKIVAHEFAAGFGTRLAYANCREDRARISRIDAYYLRSASALRSLVNGSWSKHLGVRRAARTLRRAFSIA